MMPTSVAPLEAAVVQLTSTQDVGANLRKAATLCERAVDAGVRWIVLPENFGFLGHESEAVGYAQDVDGGPFTAPLRDIARRHRVWILAGSIPEVSDDVGRIYNTSVLIGPGGETAAAYRKVHLFDVDFGGHTQHAESRHVIAGDQGILTSIAGWNVGLSVCYDLRFPEMYRPYALKHNAHVLTVPAAFTLHTGKDHWEPLLRARAIENQCYVLAAGQFGHHSSKRASWGKSAIIDPWGTVLALAAEKEGFVRATLDFEFLQKVRGQLPALDHHRL